MLTLLLGVLAPGTAAAQPACSFATSGEDLSVTVAMRGTPGLGFRVDWGDGAIDSVRRLNDQRDRGYIRHTYSAPGQYTIAAIAREPGGGGCALELTVDVPYPPADDEDSRAILPAAGAGPDEPDDEPPDRGQAAPGAGALRPTVVVTPPDLPTPAGESSATLVPEPTAAPAAAPSAATPLEAIGAILERIGGWLWGRR